MGMWVVRIGAGTTYVGPDCPYRRKGRKTGVAGSYNRNGNAPYLSKAVGVRCLLSPKRPKLCVRPFVILNARCVGAATPSARVTEKRDGARSPQAPAPRRAIAPPTQH